MNAVDSSPFRESPDLFEVEATNGMPRASIDKLPESWITEEYKRDAVGDPSGCSVCLQVRRTLNTCALAHYLIITFRHQK